MQNYIYIENINELSNAIRERNAVERAKLEFQME